ncbi:MAG: M14 family zinc carboxypeptidase [Thermomicrobiales bacterium]
MPRAKLTELEGFLTTSSVAELLGLSPYLIKARITDGLLPPATRVSEAGVLLFDNAWVTEARVALSSVQRRKRRRGAREVQPVPSPDQVLGHRMGEAGWLPTWHDIVRYFRELDAASPNVHMEELGTTTSGLPYIVVYVAAADGLQADALERNRGLLQQLWDPRQLAPEEFELLVYEARSVGIILATQHSTEIGAAVMSLELAYDLATRDDKLAQDVLENTITVIVPSHNPDGVQMVAEWYERWLGTEYEGVDMPWLYHPYTGHDNNRDWFMLTQAETKLYVDLHNREHPQAVFDMHQMGRKGVRFMVPPFIDPLDPNQDPVIQQGFAALGTHIAQRMTAKGMAGVATNAIFDNYSPSLAYGNYHGSVDLLSEAASVKLATPLVLEEKDLRDEHGFDPKQRTWNHPLPWKGGEWTLRDIVEYDKAAAFAFLEHLAVNREQWLRDYRSLSQRQIDRTEKPYAFIIPSEQRDPAAVVELIQILQRGLVEVEEATAPFAADGVTYPAGTRIVRLEQPAAAFAKTLLEVQVYPDLREWPGGPPKKPYDIAGHTLPIQMGVRAIPVDRPLAKDLPLTVLEPVEPTGLITEIEGAVTAWTIDPRSNAAIATVERLLAAGIPVYRVREQGGTSLEAGTILVPDAPGRIEAIEDIVADTGSTAAAIATPGAIPVWRQQEVRLGVYKPWTASMDEGWARWVLEAYGQPYTSLSTPDVRQGGLRARFDTILIPDMTANDLVNGRPEKDTRYGDDPYPPEYVGGLGEVGLDALRQFVDAGGILVAIDNVTPAIIDAFALPVRRPLADLKDDAFYCPGSLLKVVMDGTNPLGFGLPRETPVLFLNSQVFEGAGSEARSIARYPVSNPNLSGWILGAEHLSGKSALVEVSYGQGRIVLFGFRPYFRAQTRATYKAFFNAVLRAGLVEATLELPE